MARNGHGAAGRQNGAERLERFLIALIQRPGAERGQSKRVKFLLWGLKRLSNIYMGLVQLRMLLYRKGIFRHHELGCQVISVGNLTVGGTGKTPVVEVFARELQKEGRKVAILSRGYKKAEPTFGEKLVNLVTLRERRNLPRIVSDGKKLLLDSHMSGDEPYMLASNLSNVAVLVDKDRVKSGRYAINKLGCDTLVLDDGFQYLRLRSRIQVCLVDRMNPFGNENMLPRGILREPIKNIKRADFIFITKSTGSGDEELIARIKKLNPKAEIIVCKHTAKYLKNMYTKEQADLEILKGMKIVSLSGIAAPRGFEKELRARGATLLDKVRYADHHRYTQQEIIDIINKAKLMEADAIITTEKDAVRFPRLERRDVPIYFMRVDIEILSGAKDFHSCIERICIR
ncbi:tetraacyldisaccharide 4'-kinase [bacterium E08(2017)]|nr:tetraacyldisaccharide 4'-kinase [bacterium E08(2017)]